MYEVRYQVLCTTYKHTERLSTSFVTSLVCTYPQYSEASTSYTTRSTVGRYIQYSTGTEVSFVRTLRTVYTGSVLKFEGKACSGPPSFVHSILLLLQF